MADMNMGTSSNLIKTAILTDAGHECLPYEEALAWFDVAELMAWWVFTLEQMAEKQVWLDVERYASKCAEQPKLVDVIVAKAGFQSHRWCRVIGLHDWSLFRSEHEAHAIRLGIRLRESLERPDLLVINDNKPAVKRLRKDHPNVIWQRRAAVRVVHDLRLNHATKTFGPSCK